MVRGLLLAAALWVGAVSPAFAEQADETDLAGLRRAMDNHLKDAESARFKDVRIGSDGTTCGLVNAKNSYGAYAGYEPFLALKLGAGSFYVIGIEEASGKVCAQQGL